MTKFLLLLLLASSMFTNGFSQKIDFADKSNVWHYVRHVENAHPHSWTYENDVYSYDTTPVVKNGKTYFKLAYTLLRMDTIANKLYYYRFSDSSDNLLLNYNLNAGDSFVLNGSYNGGSHTYTYHILSLDTVFINNIPYKHFITKTDDTYLSIAGNNYVEYVEGIGCLMYNPAYISDPQLFIDNVSNSWSSDLICFKNKNSYPLIHPALQSISSALHAFDNQTSCNDTTLDINKTIKTNNPITIYPQPALDQLNFKFPNNIAEGSLYIINIVGKQVYQYHFNQKQTLQISCLALSGIYFYRIEDKTDNISYTGKLIFQ